MKRGSLWAVKLAGQGRFELHITLPRGSGLRELLPRKDIREELVTGASWKLLPV